MRRAAVLVLLAVAIAGCGSSGGSGQITVGAARTFKLAGFAPTTVAAGRPTRLSFTIAQPSGTPLTRYRTGLGPHTGVHVIPVRSDLGAIVHVHPPIGADRRVNEDITLDMEMGEQTYQLVETSPGLYQRSAPALVMVGHWGLSFEVVPPGKQPFGVLLVDRATG